MATTAFSIQVQTRYVPEQSDPDKGHYLFAYTIRIQNVGQVAGQLISRHWIIADANNHIEEVRGLGVVGNQPLLQPGESFEYTSACPLPTTVGSMRGTYHFVTEQGAPFEVTIPEFALALPRTLH
ncbi:MAG: Co2+/Mg2+ efflux protein ApaG [Burkholderiaceae bacterium]|nr:MAG: Co2+/Mg2+ efflux protein ApaG [Burkholderiaceae bacterium]